MTTLAVTAWATTGFKKHLSLATDLETYTLVQYVGSSACIESAIKVCHPDLSTTGFSQMSHNDETICTKLHQNTTTTMYQVEACLALAGGACPETTCGDCKGFFHNELVVDQCNDGYKLVKSDDPSVKDCNTSDVALGRWCNKVPAKAEEETTEETTEETKAPPAMLTLASALQPRVERPVTAMLTLASAYRRSEPLPSQGFEGASVAHDDKKTQTADWRREYGPKTAPQVMHVNSGASSLTSFAIVLLAFFF